jgi:hypothetical protein
MLSILCAKKLICREAKTETLSFHPNFDSHNVDHIFMTREEVMSSMSSTPSILRPPIPLGASAAITQPPPMPANEFCHNLVSSDVKQCQDLVVPSDVKQCHDDHMNPDVVVPVQDLVPVPLTSAVSKHLKCFHKNQVAGDKVIICNGVILVVAEHNCVCFVNHVCDAGEPVTQ